MKARNASSCGSTLHGPIRLPGRSSSNSGKVVVVSLLDPSQIFGTHRKLCGFACCRPSFRPIRRGSQCDSPCHSFWKRFRACRARCRKEAAVIPFRDAASAGLEGHRRPQQGKMQPPSHHSCLPAVPSAFGRGRSFGFAVASRKNTANNGPN